ncbi:MAG TPA: helix-turn-helix transcriptional regulator [Gemmatimonadales bacterium]|nr:helix-turn-helix transcriptional regulator [Gemmatimonadales bacterium]
MRLPRRQAPGRPKGPLPEARHLLTRRIRRLIDEAHLGNLREAAAHTRLPYATLRDLYLGRTTSPGLRTLVNIAEAYGTSLEWFTSDDTSASPRLLIEGQLPPDPEYGRGREGRRIRIPLAAWSLARCFLELERRLTKLPPRNDRPIIGSAVDPDEIRRSLTAYLLGPILEAQREGMVQILGAEPPFRGTRNPGAEDERQWVELLRALGKFWELIVRPES